MKNRASSSSSPHRPPAKRRKGLRTAIIVTVLLHILGAAIAFLYIPDLRQRVAGTQTPANTAAPTQPRAATPAAPTEPPKPKKQPESWNRQVEAKVQSLVEAAEDRDATENRTVLEEKANQLNRLSSEASIEDMENVLTDALKLEARATAPVDNPPEGGFDAKSAQFHTVRREAKPTGGHRYFSVMVDADGRSMEVPLSEVEGESVYKTMKMVEENPLLDKVYRQFVIPAMDKASKASVQLEKAAAEVEKAPANP